MAISPTEIVNWSIYRITSPSNRVYIGITCNFNQRFSVYKSNVASKQTLIYNSIKKYGFESHQVEVIDSFRGNLSYAQGKEMFWVRSYMSNKNRYPEQNGLNLTDGGDGTRGYKQSQEKIEKQRQKMLGRKQDPEVVRKRAEKQRGRKMNFTHMTEEFKKKLSEANKLYRHTEEAKKKIGEASKGNKHRLGSKMTPEQIEHRSSLLRGQKKSPENLKKHIEMVIRIFAKPIFQYDLNGNFIKEYPMITTAAKEIGIPKLGIHRNLSGQCKQSRGFIFKYKNNVVFDKVKMKRREFKLIDIGTLLNTNNDALRSKFFRLAS